MNTKNNRRRQRSRELIETAFIGLLQKKEIGQITVAELCAETGLNRSTFYANYLDIYDLADHLRDRLEGEVTALFGDEASVRRAADWVTLFTHIRDNPIFYRTYFKLGYDQTHTVDLDKMVNQEPIFADRHLDYHVEFFRAGFNAIVKKWLADGCRETPEEMNAILVSEYRGRVQPTVERNSKDACLHFDPKSGKMEA